jgi:hypothetical protein
MAALFTTTVEIPDERMGLSQSRVLAAVGTTLPKTIIPVTVILGATFTGGDPQLAVEISISVILGAPFLLATLGMFMIGALMLGFKRRRRHDVTGRYRCSRRPWRRRILHYLLCCRRRVGRRRRASWNFRYGPK